MSEPDSSGPHSWGAGTAGISWVEAKDAAGHPTTHRTVSPQQRIVWRNVSSAKKVGVPRTQSACPGLEESLCPQICAHAPSLCPVSLIVRPPLLSLRTVPATGCGWCRGVLRALSVLPPRLVRFCSSGSIFLARLMETLVLTHFMVPYELEDVCALFHFPGFFRNAPSKRSPGARRPAVQRSRRASCSVRLWVGVCPRPRQPELRDTGTPFPQSPPGSWRGAGVHSACE